ncbi:hypothetical protein DPMN_180261 [Dreissena polymorpha]|uniref:Uncharacterized protein n=1 Tax=Dreissena polymorpha TaxID=45954 RepID=A0A9D4ILI0_DREPO|nr:hypothetical protein DPMN_180261 [Dreissena polymorpha]
MQYNNVAKCFDSPTDSLVLERTAQQPYAESFKQIHSIFMLFREAEAMCVPKFLRYEFNRPCIGTTKPTGRPKPFYTPDDCASVQIEPFLYYLQYLTYRKLYKEINTPECAQNIERALKAIISYIEMAKGKQNNIRFRKHFDTSLNMLGHFWEMEENLVTHTLYNGNLNKMRPFCICFDFCGSMFRVCGRVVLLRRLSDSQSSNCLMYEN